MSKTSGMIATFHVMKFAAMARLSEERSPEFRSHRRMNPWNSNHFRVCDVSSVSFTHICILKIFLICYLHSGRECDIIVKH